MDRRFGASSSVIRMFLWFPGLSTFRPSAVIMRFGSGLKIKQIPDTSSRNELPPHRVAGLSLGDSVRSRAAASPHQKDSAEVVHLMRIPLFGGFQACPTGGPGADLDLAGWVLCLWPGNASESPGGAGKSWWLERNLDFSRGSVVSKTRLRIKGKKNGDVFNIFGCHNCL